MEREPILPETPPPLPSTETLPFASIHAVADPPPGKAAIAIVVSSIALSLVATITLASCDGNIRAGRANATPPFLLSVSDMAWLAAWILCTGTIIVACVRAHGRLRWLAAGGLAAILAAVPATCAHRPYPDDAYLTGFTTWARTHINTTAVRQWHASLPPVTTPITIPPAQYPPAITSLAPDAVEQHATGIVLQWGRQATWSNSRKVFVGSSDASAPPTDPFHAWRQVLPGLYASRGASD